MTRSAAASVQLISYTPDAMDMLIFTKQTRLQLSPGLFEEIKKWPEEKKLQELNYMANTIPSSWEFVDYSFLITGVSRAFTHQLVRTRNGSYAQQTMRVLDVKDYEFVHTSDDQYYKIEVDAVNFNIMEAYKHMLDAGIAIEDARGILPTNIATNIVAKFNLRTLSELCKSRTGGRTQGEYRDIMKLIAQEVLRVHPWAEMFLFPQGRNHYDELERFACKLKYDERMELLKICDRMRKI